MISPNEISSVTNQVSDLLAEANTIPNHFEKTQKIAKAIEISCSFFQRLAEDDIFIDYSSTTEGNIDIESSVSAIRRFLAQESSLLTQAGFNQQTIQNINQHITARLNYLKENPITGNELKLLFDKLRNVVCNQAERMRELLKSEYNQRMFIFGLVGIGFISTNILFGVPFGPFFVSLSSSIGGGVAGDAIKQLLPELLSQE